MLFNEDVFLTYSSDYNPSRLVYTIPTLHLYVTTAIDIKKATVTINSCLLLTLNKNLK